MTGDEMVGWHNQLDGHEFEQEKKPENSRKTSTSASLTVRNLWTEWITINHGKFLKRWSGNTRPPDLPPEKSVCRSKSNMEQWTGFKLGMEYVKAVYCHPAYLTYMQSTSCKM